MLSTSSGLDWQEASQLKPSIMPPPAMVMVFKKERRPYVVFTIVMLFGLLGKTKGCYRWAAAVLMAALMRV
jgi:hypothetical protein